MEALEAVVLALGVEVPSVVVRGALCSRRSLGIPTRHEGEHARSQGQGGADACGTSASSARAHR